MRIVVLIGSVRQERQGMRVVRWITRAFENEDHEVQLIDPARLDLPMLDRMYKEFDDVEAPMDMEKVAETLREADGFVVVSAEYNHGIPPALKNLLDHFQREYFWRPAAIVTYSAAHTGGARVQLPLRATLGELGMVTIPTMLDVPDVSHAMNEDGHEVDEQIDGRVERFLEEFSWYARALAREYEDGVPYGDPRGEGD